MSQISGQINTNARNYTHFGHTPQNFPIRTNSRARVLAALDPDCWRTTADIAARVGVHRSIALKHLIYFKIAGRAQSQGDQGAGYRFKLRSNRHGRA